MSSTLSIEVPVAETYLRLVRMLVTAFATGSTDLDVEQAARVRLAASEVCVALMAAVPPDRRSGTVRIGARVDPDCVHLEVRLTTGGPVDDRDLAVIRALADDVETVVEGDDQTVRVRLRLDVGGRAGVGT